MTSPKPPRRRIPPNPKIQRVKPPSAPRYVMPDPIPGLPLLRTSERGSFRRCPQRWWWGSVEGLQSQGEAAIPLWFGTGWHLVMAHHYSGPGSKRGKEPLKVIRDYVGDTLLKIRVNKDGEDYSHEQYVEARTLMEQMFGAYIEKYGNDDNWSVIQPEKTGVVIIRHPQTREPMLNYVFTYDLVYRDEATGLIWLGEHKTAKQISTRHLSLDDQAGSYFSIATSDLRASGMIGPKERIHGIMYNFVKKSPPSDKERGPDGYVHNLPRKEDFIAAFEEEGIEAEEYASGRGTANLKRMAEIARDYGLTVWGPISKNQPGENFLRQEVRRTQAEVRSQIARIESEGVVMEQFRSGALPLYKNPTKDCSWDCSFYELCLLHERGSDWEEYRDAVFVKGDPYGPYRKDAEES